MMRRLSFLCAILAIFLVAVVGSVSAQDSSTDQVIHAAGSGNVVGTPDRAQITFSVQTENPDVKVAQSDNAVQMAKVVNAITGAGITQDSLKTSGYSISPVYDNSNSGILNPTVKTYQVTNTLTVTLDNVSRTGEIIDIAVANGVNQANSVQFMLSDTQAQALRSEALKNAVANARSDADTVAGALGVNITGMGTVDITQSYTPVVYSNTQWDVAGAAKSVAAPTPVQPGDITVNAQVAVTYTY
jgi:uncharacterized protein YggE